MTATGPAYAAVPARATGLPRPLDVEVPRLRLVRRLEERWARSVTLVVAGPGFGKTTVLAQTVRAHLLAPRGIDAWVTCVAAHEDPVLFARTLIHAVSEDGCRRTAPGAADVVDALISRAPLSVCLLLDDVHEIPADSAGAALLGAVAAALPATAHLVLAGREAPELPLARREAAGDVIRIGGAELAFTDAEVRALARRLGREASVAEALHGWPALVRLAFAAGSSAPWQYAREEILSRLPDPRRRALAALAALGSATADEVATITGGPVVLEDLARIPLVGILDDGRYRAHDLWTEAVARTMTAPESRVVQERAVAILVARGDLVRAGRLAQQARDWRLLAELAVVLVHTTLSALPRGIAERWLGFVPPAMAEEPAFVLLRAAVTHAGDYTDPVIDPLLDQAWQGFLAGRDDDGATAALGQAIITAHSRADGVRLTAVAEWADRLDSPSPVATLLRHTATALAAEINGDPETALTHFAQAPVFEVPPALALATWRYHYHCLNMCGRGTEAAELADRHLDDASDERVQLSGAVARWLAGDPSGLNRMRGPDRPTAVARTRPPQTGSATATAREAFVATALAAVLTSSCGAEQPFPPQPCGDPATHDNPRDAVLACVAEAAVAVARGDECAAARAYTRFLARWPLEVRLAERHLRRFLSLGYVLSDRLRTHWDTVDLGPSHHAAREAARALRGARAGDLSAAGSLSPAHALCFLPLPWSVELAARLVAADHAGGVELGRWLADTVGPAVHRQIRETALTTNPAVAAGATQLLAVLPALPPHRTCVQVMGVVRLTRDGVPVDAPELRRARVRQLLSVLTLHPVLLRDQAIELLWPGLDPTKAARNMRVTLTHLRRLLEPDRSGGDASYHVRTDGNTIRLLPSESLSVDLWTFDQLDTHASQARAAGDTDRAAELLDEAVSLWRGDPLPDLRDLRDPCATVEIDRLRARHVRDLLALGELRLVTDHAAEALALAQRALSVEPFDSRGHRLALAAALRTQDPAHITATRDTVLTSLRQLGVPPDPATAILLRQTPTG